MLLRKPVWKGYITYDSIIWCNEKLKTPKTVKKDQSLPGLGVGGCGWIDEGQGIETTLTDTLMVDKWHFSLTQIHRIYNTKSEP